MLFRFVKSIVLFIVMFYSLSYLGIPSNAAIIVSTIPLVLGMVGILTGPAFSLAGIVFIVAALSSLVPEEKRNLPSLLASFLQQLQNTQQTQPKASATPNNASSIDGSKTPTIVATPSK
jgi:membrane-bound ClpP family serine protease